MSQSDNSAAVKIDTVFDHVTDFYHDALSFLKNSFNLVETIFPLGDWTFIFPNFSSHVVIGDFSNPINSSGVGDVPLLFEPKLTSQWVAQETDISELSGLINFDNINQLILGRDQEQAQWPQNPAGESESSHYIDHALFFDSLAVGHIEGMESLYSPSSYLLAVDLSVLDDVVDGNAALELNNVAVAPNTEITVIGSQHSVSIADDLMLDSSYLSNLIAL
ncbi:MAG: hypothetical protein K0U12_05210 [Gammaproteobacteria bacterium]|nr:hypothetical protein [Gammaproteobacteria bacterium]